MLPEKLSNEVCSLQPNKFRRVLDADIKLDKDGHVQAYQFKRGTRIKSVARLTYNEVEGFIDNKFEGLEGASSTLFSGLLFAFSKTSKTFVQL